MAFPLTMSAVTLKMFADDAKIYSSVRSESEAEKIQENLEKLQNWSDTWLLRFNAGKCKTMHIGSGNPHCDYHMGETTLDGTGEEKDLGIYITSDFKSSTQSSKAATKGMNCLRVVRRSFKYINADSFQILYKTYIRPHLEYCVQAWCPWLEKDKQALEKVQRRANKLVPALKNLRYEEWLQALNLYSLEKRRERGDLIETFKMLKGLERVDSSKFFQLTDSNSRTRGHPLKIYKSSLKKNLGCRKHFFSQRVVNSWNALPEGSCEC